MANYRDIILRAQAICGLFLSAVLGSPAVAANVEIDTAAGAAIIAAKPEHVASLDIAAIDTLHALGVRIAGVPNKLYVRYLEPVKTTSEKIGTLFDPDFDALKAIAPNIIIVGSRSSKHIAMLSQTALVIDMTIAGRNIVEQAKARIMAYGTLFGIQEKAAKLVAQIENKIKEAKNSVAGKGDALIVVTNADRISAFGVDSRFGWLHDTVGLPEAANGLVGKPRGHAMTIEQIAEIDPDWLIIVDRQAAIGRGGSAANVMLQEALAANREGAGKMKVISLDAAPVYVASGGAASILQTLDEIISAFGVNEATPKPQ